MESRLSKKELIFVKNLFLTTVLGGLVGVLNYFFNVFIARYTDQNIWGTFSSALGVIYLIQIPAVAIQAVITRGVAKNKGKDLNRYKWSSFIVFSLVGVVVSILFFMSKGVISSIASIPNNIVIYLALTFLVAFVTPVAKGLLLGLEKIVTLNIVMLIETVLKFAIGAVAIWFDGSLALLILANCIPAFLTTLFIMPLVKFDGGSGERVRISIKELLLTTIYFLLLTVPFNVDLILVNPEFRSEYAAISLLGKLVYFASITTAFVMFARLSNEKKESGQRRSLIISLVLSLSIGLFISMIYFLLSSVVVDMTVGARYLSISNYIGVFGLCMAGFAFVYMVANFFISKGYFRYLYILLFTSVLQIVLFIFRNGSLHEVIVNQVVMYILLFVLTLVYLLFKLRNWDDGKGEEVKEEG